MYGVPDAKFTGLVWELWGAIEIYLPGNAYQEDPRK
jgi:hypothetical protein